jgi:hypothetical protein
VSRESRDLWRPPALDRIGAQLHELEHADAARRRRRRVSISGGLVAALVAVLALLDTGRVAHALSVINRAPAAAAASESVRFHSAISITAGSRRLNRFSESGEIDFAGRNYSTTLQFGHGEAVEQRRVGGVLYVAQLPRRHPNAPIRWIAFPLAHEASTTFASAPEGEEFTSPLVMLDELGGTRAPVTDLGPEDLHGVPTTRYHLETSLASLLSASPGAGSQPAAYRSVTAVLTVWLDRDGRPRQVVETFAGTSSAGRASIRIVTEFTGYAQPIMVRAPLHVSARSKRSIVAPALAASPSRVFEQLMFVHP